jgi:hypothetical protein
VYAYIFASYLNRSISIMMKKLFTIFAGSIILFSSCNKESIKGSGAVITEARSLPTFSEIQVNGDADLNVVYGAGQEVSVTGYQNLLPVYETKMVGTVLYLQFKPNYYRIRNNNIKVKIVVPALTYLRLNGSGNIIASNFRTGSDLNAAINGSGNILLQDSKYFKANYTINGSGNITASTTEAAEAAAEIHGSGNIRLKVSEKLTANIAGSGNVDYWGNPVTMSTQISGSGKVNKK